MKLLLPHVIHNIACTFVWKVVSFRNVDSKLKLCLFYSEALSFYVYTRLFNLIKYILVKYLRIITYADAKEIVYHFTYRTIDEPKVT